MNNVRENDNSKLKSDSLQESETSPNEVQYYPNTNATIFLRSCEEEIINPISGTKIGIIPEWINGSLIRNGPGSLKLGDYQFKHLFDGSALLHRYEIKNGTVTYQCQFLKSEAYKKGWETRRIVFTEFGTESVPDPCSTILKRISVIFNPRQSYSDNANITIYPFKDEVFALSEGVYAHRINPRTLETEERKDISNFVPMVIHYSSHPHIDSDGTMYSLALAMTFLGPIHHIVRFTKPKDEKKSTFDTATVVASVPAKWSLHPSYMHTFGITEKYFILIQQPLTISLVKGIAARLKNQAAMTTLKWFEGEKTVITLISRHSGEVTNYYTKAFFFLHTINQFELNDKYVVLDVCSYKNPDFIKCMFTEALKNAQTNPDFAKMAKNHPVRFILPLEKRISEWRLGKPSTENLISLSTSKAEAYLQTKDQIFLIPEELCSIGCETPQIYYKKFSGKPYRYFYAIGADTDSEHPGAIIKVDTCRKTFKTWYEKDCYASEPIFFPRPNSKNEDDGILLSSLLWGEDENKVGLIILDASTLLELGRVEFKTPSPAPKCLHGWFLPENT